MIRKKYSRRTSAFPLAAVLLAGSAFSPFSISDANAQSNSSACTITTAPGASLDFAKRQFSQSCPNQERRDCDPFQGGWQCSTENLPLAGGPSTPVTPPARPSTPPGGNAVLSVQAENAVRTTGSGWSTESSLNGFNGSGYIVWRGSDDFRATDQDPPAGINTYNFTVSTPGTYEFTARVQARVGNGSAAGDQDNDAWVRFTSGTATANVRGDSSKWTKFFVSGSDESWKNYSGGEQFDPKFFTRILRDLPAGQHQVLVGGRSSRFAIDTVGLRLVSASGPSVPADPTPTPPTRPTIPDDPIVAGVCSGTGGSLQEAIADYANSCPQIPRRDCDPVGGGDWLCSSEIIGGSGPNAGGGENPARPNAPTIPPIAAPTPAPAPAPTRPVPAPTPAQPVPPSRRPGAIGRLTRGDLLALHYDNCPDRDDGHAVASAKAVLDAVGITDAIVVNGTCGASNRSSYQPSSEAVLRAVFGNDWLDGFNDQTNSVNTSADRWAAVLANGDDVWVAEGGPSDFTANVLRRIGAAYPSVDRSRVRVVQHSHGSSFNEAKTSRAGIDLIRRVADYITIPNGNRGGNGSANFNSNFNSRSNTFVTTARQSRFAQEWNAAFNYLSPNNKIDFSDTVELLYIIDDTTTLTVNDFANRYLR